MCRGIGQGVDDLELLDDRARPSMRDDQRQGIRMCRADMDEMDVEPIDFGDGLREGIEPRLDFPPVVVRLPVAHEVLQHRLRHALSFVGDGLLVGPPCGSQAAAKVGEVLLGHIDAERSIASAGAADTGDEGKSVAVPAAVIPAAAVLKSWRRFRSTERIAGLRAGCISVPGASDKRTDSSAVCCAFEPLRAAPSRLNVSAQFFNFRRCLRWGR